MNAYELYIITFNEKYSGSLKCKKKLIIFIIVMLNFPSICIVKYAVYRNVYKFRQILYIGFFNRKKCHLDHIYNEPER